ncbi:hypothetical protein FACS18942_08160 [Planctomycetales bacterium]|nr:hypothetical protein FACS18942_08160 [Planctomycetales bacterium]GHT38376.1 hypothetical protein FACS189427_12420 [Planctomycetales bacterium]
MKIYTFSKEFTERIKSVVETAEAGNVPQASGNNAGLLAGFTSPLEITAEGKAKRLWNIDGTYQTRDEDDEFEYADPLGLSPSAGDKIFALWRGHWELIGGGGTSAATYGIISQHIGGHRFNDDEDYDAEKPQGKIKIIGKEYPEGTAIADGEPCICNELAEDDNELLLTGLQVKCIKVDEIDNPDYVDDDETPDEPEKITRWTAIETEGEYFASLDSDLTSNGTSTITLGEHQFTVHPVLIPTGKKVAGGTNIIAHRTNKTLAAISHPCPVSDSNSN